MTCLTSRPTARRGLLSFLALAPLTACAPKPSPDLASYENERPLLIPQKVFAGELKAWGVVQGPRGNVVRRMWVEIDGDWDGETLTIAEHMTFENGEKMARTWAYRQDGPDNWIGSAEGIEAPSTGRVSGNAFNRRYTGMAHMPDGTMVMAQFDEWLWQLDEKRLFCRAYISRLGIAVAQASVFFERKA